MASAFFPAIRAAGARWIDEVAEVVAEVGRVFVRVRAIRFVEQPDGSFAVFDHAGPRAAAHPVRIRDGIFVDEQGRALGDRYSGTEIAVVLGAGNFVVRDLELPGKAAGFLPGVIRAQLDRLTPWTAEQAVFGFRQRSDAGTERVHATVAVTARSLVQRFTTMLHPLHPASIVIFADVPSADPKAMPIHIADDRAGDRRNRTARRLVLAGAAAVVTVACASVAGASLAGAYFASRQAEVDAQITTLRGRLQSGPAAMGASASLHRQKRDAPSATLTLEALARLLPDDTFLTDMEIRGDTLTISGLAPDAARVIRLVEQSPAFAGAAFTAPTTRTPNERGERFQIETHLKPPAAVR